VIVVMARYLLRGVALAAAVAISCTTAEEQVQHPPVSDITEKETQQPSPESITMQTLREADEELLQVEVGDMVFTTSHLSFRHSDGSVSRVRPLNGEVQWSRDGSMNSGRIVRTLIRGGMFSQQFSKTLGEISL
jgi:hypothetical protein